MFSFHFFFFIPPIKVHSVNQQLRPIWAMLFPTLLLSILAFIVPHIYECVPSKSLRLLVVDGSVWSVEQFYFDEQSLNQIWNSLRKSYLRSGMDVSNPNVLKRDFFQRVGDVCLLSTRASSEMFSKGISVVVLIPHYQKI